MKAVLTRVSSARVLVSSEVVGELPRPGLLGLVGISVDDNRADVATMARKIAELRILAADEADGPAEVSASDIGAPVLQPIHALRGHPKGAPALLAAGGSERRSRAPFQLPRRGVTQAFTFRFHWRFRGAHVCRISKRWTVYCARGNLGVTSSTPARRACPK